MLFGGEKMRKGILLVLVMTFCLCGCEREALTDPVLFCESYNRIASTPIKETDTFLRGDSEFLLYAGETLVRLKTNEDGAIHTAIVTGKVSPETASVARNTFTVLAQPMNDAVPQTVTEQCAQQDVSVQTAESKRFGYAVYRDGETVTAVQVNLLLSSLPVQPSLRLS